MRATYYVVRRHLRMSAADWDALAWWEQRLLTEGLNEEFKGNGEGPSGGAEGVVFSNRPGEMSRLGFTERQLS